MGWSKAPAVTILAKCKDGQIQGCRFEAIEGLRGIEIPLINLSGETKDRIAMLDMMDLSKFTWPETCSTTEPRNLRQWRDGIDVIEGLRTETGTETDKAAIGKMKFFVDRGFSVRIGISLGE